MTKTSPKNDLNQEVVCSALAYDPATGRLTWKFRSDASKQWNSRFAGKVAGNVNTLGYIIVRLCGRKYYAHRLIVLMVTGHWSESDVDHVDLDKSNNVWVNLREANRSGNSANKTVQRNNVLGVKGVGLFRGKKYKAQIKEGSKNRHLGLFSTLEEASAAYEEAAIRIYGEFARAS